MIPPPAPPPHLAPSPASPTPAAPPHPPSPSPPFQCLLSNYGTICCRSVAGAMLHVYIITLLNYMHITHSATAHPILFLD